MDNAIIWLIRLLAAHLITDFILQPDSWVKAKRKKHLNAKEFWFHVSLTTMFAIWFTRFEGWWWIGLTIFITHWLIDWYSHKRLCCCHNRFYCHKNNLRIMDPSLVKANQRGHVLRSDSPERIN